MTFVWFFLLSFGAACALEVERWGFRAGYGYQYKDTKSRPNNYQIIAFLPSAVVPLSGERSPGWLRGRFEWLPELFLGMFTHPYHRPILGATPLQFRYLFEPRCKVKPYLLAGAGVLYANVNRRETRWDLNFNLQVAAGLEYPIGGSTSLIAEYRHIHFSNAGLHEDNSGLNTHTFLAGVSIKR